MKKNTKNNDENDQVSAVFGNIRQIEKRLSLQSIQKYISVERHFFQLFIKFFRKEYSVNF